MPKPTDNVMARVARRADDAFEGTLDQLHSYLSIPAISCEPAHYDDVRQLAARICNDFERLGLSGAKVIELDGALPSVIAEYQGAGPQAPTILIYGHLDLQPVVLDNWHTDPHTPVVQGDRIYARGAADDMGGWISHMAAISAWLEETGSLPCNLRLFIEGEEEIGSPNLERYMDAFPEAFAADVMVLTDCENPSVDIPGLTVSLRGLLEIDLSCQALKADGHSGLWGNMVPDPVMALFKLVSRLTDDDGRLVVGRVEVPQSFTDKASRVPLNSDVIREGAHLLEGVDPLPLRGRSAPEWLWRQPALTVVSTTLPSPSEKKNAIRKDAAATLSVRVPPGVSPKTLYAKIEAELLRDAPAGVKVQVSCGDRPGESWLYEPSGPAFDAVDRAYESAWGVKPVQIGVGGSIPFVAMFGRRFSELPLILNGVMDPLTTAHGPNESMHLGVFRKAIAANVHLYAELSDALAKR